ncbi:MAG: universal stress protein [Coriobacteriia bacterium]|nr:universal stress protein [Coriobacteriia bacterium]
MAPKIKEYERIFAALDGGPTMEGIAWRAVREASSNHAALLMGHVLDSVPDALTVADYRDLCSRVCERIKDELREPLAAAEKDPNIPSVEVQVKYGLIQSTLTQEFIDPFDPDLVICGERGLSDIKYAFVGSTSTFLIRNLRCDVLVVKQD